MLRVLTHIPLVVPAALAFGPPRSAHLDRCELVVVTGEHFRPGFTAQLQLGGEPWAEVLASHDDELASIEVSRARGTKCERCWHYEGDVGQHPEHPHICGRCVGVLKRRTHQLA